MESIFSFCLVGHGQLAAESYIRKNRVFGWMFSLLFSFFFLFSFLFFFQSCTEEVDVGKMRGDEGRLEVVEHSKISSLFLL